MRKIALVLGLAVLLAFAAEKAPAKDKRLYVSTFRTSFHHIGMKISLSGLFNKSPESDTTWQFYGRPNNYVYGFDIFLPSQGEIMALATHTGVHQSRDGGKTWKETSDWKMTEVHSVQFDRTNSDIVYAGTPYGFYKSVDGGHNWQQKNNGLHGPDATYIPSFVVSHVDPDHIFAATEDVVYESKDAGESWRKAGLEIPHIRVIEQNPQDAEMLVVGTEDNGLYFSLSSGKHWEKREDGVVHSTFYTVTFDPTNPEVIYAGGFSTGIYKSVDGGQKWQNYINGLDNLDISTIAVDPIDSQKVYAGSLNGGVFGSEDGGETWSWLGIDNGQISEIKVVDYDGEDNE